MNAIRARLATLPRWTVFLTLSGRLGVITRRKGEEVRVILARPFQHKSLHRDVVVSRRPR